jgi:hypothetical protein
VETTTTARPKSQLLIRVFFGCVVCRGMRRKSSFASFFAGLRVESVVWTFTHRNRPSGEAFVTFASVEEAAKGLGKHKEHLNKRYIEVFASSEAQAEAAHSQKRSDGPSGVPMSGGNASAAKHDGGDTHVMMYGLPYTVTVVDIEEFFEGFNFVPGSVEIDTDSSGRALGTGSINFKKVKKMRKKCFVCFFFFFFLIRAKIRRKMRLVQLLSEIASSSARGM